MKTTGTTVLAQALEPCPFCGGKASADGITRYSDDHEAWFSDGSRIIEAFFCNCMVCGATNKGMCGHQTRDKAIEAWNRRASLRAADAGVQPELKGLADYLRAQASQLDVFSPTMQAEASAETLRKWAAALFASPASPAPQPDIERVLQQVEDKVRGIPQAHMAAQVIGEIRELLAAAPAPQAMEGQQADAYTKALAIRTKQGWTLSGRACPVLYTDTINGDQVCRDDLWIATTAAMATKEELAARAASPAVAPSAGNAVSNQPLVIDLLTRMRDRLFMLATEEADIADEADAMALAEEADAIIKAAGDAASGKADWRQAAEWLRNNYQDYATITSLCEAMIAATPPAPPEPQPALENVAAIEAAIDRIEQVINQRREPGWSYRNTITANRNEIREQCRRLRELFVGASPEPQEPDEWLALAERLVWRMRGAVRDDSGAGKSREAFDLACAAEEALLAHLRQRPEPQEPQAGVSARELLRDLIGCVDTYDRLKQLHEMGHGTDHDSTRRRFNGAVERARYLLSTTNPPAQAGAQPLSNERIVRFAEHAADRIPASNYEGRVLHAVRMAEAALASQEPTAQQPLTQARVDEIFDAHKAAPGVPAHGVRDA